MRLPCLRKRKTRVNCGVERAGREPFDDPVKYPRPFRWCAVEGVPRETPDSRAFTQIGTHRGEGFLFRQTHQRVERHDGTQRRQHLDAICEIGPDKLIENKVCAATLRYFQNPFRNLFG